MVIDSFIEENGLAPYPPQKKLEASNTWGPKIWKNTIQDMKKNLALRKRNI